MKSITGLARQREIYLNGAAGIRPRVPADFAALEQRARAQLRPERFAYIAGGAGAESTIRRNRAAFERWRILPRMLRDVEQRDLSVTLFGQRLPTPFLLAPIGVLEMAHREADLAVARAARSLGVPFIFSNQASVAMERCAAVMGDSPRWFQLYWSRSDALVSSLVRRAEQCGCSAIVVTLDTHMLGWRTRDLDLAYLPFLEGKGIAQYTSDPVFRSLLGQPDDAPPADSRITLHALKTLFLMAAAYPDGFWRGLLSGDARAAVQKFITTYSRPSLSWENLPFLRERTRLPIILKGVLHPDDARKALDYGMDGLIVSNHGGRQIDGAISSIEALPAIVEAVGGRAPILLDSGVYGGADAFKALALGATAVCIGRPYAYGLALAGSAGVQTVLKNMIADFDLTMGLAGCRSVAEIEPGYLRAAGGG
jgi:lactate 2-monooxygenase